MSAYQSLNPADQQAISGNIHNAINNALTGGLELSSLSNNSPTAVKNDANNFINSLNLDFKSNPDKAAPIRNNMQLPAENLIGNIAEGYLTPDNLRDFTDYDINSSLKNNNSPEGDVANSINDLLDNNANLNNINKNQPQQQNTNIKGSIGTLTSNAYYTSVFDQFYPKTKYTFLVQIVLTKEYQDIPVEFCFLISKFDKPTFEVEYEEVNFYNFRSQVPKKTIMHPVSFTMHNDIQNKSMNFIVSYLRRISPIFNQPSSNLYETNGMDFSNATSSYGLSTKPTDGTDELSTHIISTISIYDIYNNSSTIDQYNFYNPKIKSVKFTEFDMSSSDGSEITVEFIYDNVTIDTGAEPILPQSALGVLELVANTPVKLAAETALYDQKLTELYVKLGGDNNTKDPKDEQFNEPGENPAGQDDSNTPLDSGDISQNNPETDEAINKNNVQDKGPVDTTNEQFNNENAPKEQYIDPAKFSEQLKKDVDSGKTQAPPDAFDKLELLKKTFYAPITSDKINDAIGSGDIANQYFDNNPNNQSATKPKSAGCKCLFADDE